MDESLRNVEARARDIGGVIEKTTQETADIVDERFGAVRTAAEQERARTAAAMRAAYEQANNELSSVFAQASEKFNAAAGEIRGLAQEIHRELETTREEVRRGAQELPRETAEQASALRRVVGDQVKALNELTDIVARSGRVYDIAEPAGAPARRPSSRRAPNPRAPVRRAFDAPRAEPPREMARPDSARMEPPRMEPQRTEPSRIMEPSRFRPAAPPPAAAPSRPAALRPSAPRVETESGWLSNLLERASDEGPAPAAPPRPAAPSGLDNLTLDIARMVDTSAVAELWGRYQRGEREGLFSRRLYTVQGRQTLEEIRRRYKSDPDFRGTIDHYLRNFEDLLGETNRNDRDGQQSLDLLTGDAGKVYTMLGHAAGRFE